MIIQKKIINQLYKYDVVDTKRYRYVIDYCDDGVYVDRIAVESLGTTRAIWPGDWERKQIAPVVPVLD